MRITKDEIVAGYPALTVRTFLRRYRPFTMVPEAAKRTLKINHKRAKEFLHQLALVGLIKPAENMPLGEDAAYEVTTQGNAFANASAAKPVSRKTAEQALEQFMERVRVANANANFVYRIESVVLFGSMLTDTERLGDVDIAIEFQSKVKGREEFDKRCKERQNAAYAQGRSFSSTFEWAVWPHTEVFLFLKARSRTLSLHEFSQVQQMKGVRYRALWGDPERIARLIPGGQVC